jgi:hypothetical protein
VWDAYEAYAVSILFIWLQVFTGESGIYAPGIGKLQSFDPLNTHKAMAAI